VAKLKAPLLSFGARGGISKAVVFFPWKRVNAAREYVVPTNPRTTAQKTQRGYLKDAVAEWHGANYTPDDRTAWNRFAGVHSELISGFNAFVRTFLDQAILGNIWTRMRDVVITNITSTTATIDVEAKYVGDAPIIEFGPFKTFFPYTQEMALTNEDHWSGTINGLTPDTLYYFTITYGQPGYNYTRVGIYGFRTLPA